MDEPLRRDRRTAPWFRRDRHHARRAGRRARDHDVREARPVEVSGDEIRRAVERRDLQREAKRPVVVLDHRDRSTIDVEHDDIKILVVVHVRRIDTARPHARHRHLGDGDTANSVVAIERDRVLAGVGHEYVRDAVTGDVGDGDVGDGDGDGDAGDGDGDGDVGDGDGDATVTPTTTPDATPGDGDRVDPDAEDDDSKEFEPEDEDDDDSELDEGNPVGPPTPPNMPRPQIHIKRGIF